MNIRVSVENATIAEVIEYGLIVRALVRKLDGDPSSAPCGCKRCVTAEPAQPDGPLKAFVVEFLVHHIGGVAFVFAENEERAKAIALEKIKSNSLTVRRDVTVKEVEMKPGVAWWWDGDY